MNGVNLGERYWYVKFCVFEKSCSPFGEKLELMYLDLPEL